MKDIINSFKAHLYERTSSPLLGSFIFYWIICNYKLIMVIFDKEMKLNEKFDLIKTIYPQEKITLWNGFDIYYQILLGNGLLVPLIITLIYVLLLPFASNFIYGLWIKHQNNFKKISNEKVLTKKEFGDLQRRFTELELSFDDTFSKKDNEIARLNESIQGKENIIIENKIKLDFYQKREVEYNERNSKIEKYEKELIEKNQMEKELKGKIESLEIQLIPKNNVNSILDDEEIIVLKYLGENPQNQTTPVSQKLNIHRMKLEKIYQKLFEKEFIRVNSDYTNGDKEYRIEPKGRDFLLENNLI